MILSLLISSEISSRVHISSALKKMPSKIISDGNRSALNFAQEHGIPIEVYHAVKNYDRLFEDSCVNSERASLQERNRRMIHDSDCLLCFSEKDDYYIHSAIEYAKSMGKPYKLVMCRNLYALPIGWKLRIFHNLDSNIEALNICEVLKRNQLKYSKCEWVENYFSENHKYISADIEFYNENIDEACQEILSYFGANTCLLYLYWYEYIKRKRYGLYFKDICYSKKRKKSHFYTNQTIEGTVTISSDFEILFEKIQSDLINCGLYNITKGTVEDSHFVIQFSAQKIDTSKFYALDLAEKNMMKLTSVAVRGISYVYKNSWYDKNTDDISWKPLKNKTHIDISGDDSSLDIRFW